MSYVKQLAGFVSYRQVVGFHLWLVVMLHPVLNDCEN